MTGRLGERGSASGDYLAVVAVVAVVFGSLLVFRPHTVSRHVPVDVITPVARLLGHPFAEPQAPRLERPTTPVPRLTPQRPRRPAPQQPRIMLPEWWR